MNAPRFVNSAIVRVPERLVLRRGSWSTIALGVRYGVFVHQRLGPVLVDTGYGPRATQGRQRSTLLKIYGHILRPRLLEGSLPLAELGRLGFAAGDVRRIVVTHFHPDHIAALRDFPNASFIASGKAWASIRAMPAWQRVHNGIFLELLPDDFERRLLAVETCETRLLPYGIGTGQDIFADGSCLAVDLPGHAIGHFGLLWPDLDPPLFYATDATWIGDALDDRLPRGIATVVYANNSAMRASASLVKAFRDAGGQVVICHDRVPA